MPRTLPLTENATINIEPEVAIVIIGLFSASADGEGISQVEADTLNEMLQGMDLFADYTDDDFTQLTERLNSLMTEHDFSDLMNSAIASLPNEEYREAAYVTALMVISMDEDIPEEEEDYLYNLQEALNISEERAEEMIDEIFGDDEDEDNEE